MAFRLITQARPEDLAATQWALIAAVEETAGAALARYAAPAAVLVIGELLAGALAPAPTGMPAAGHPSWGKACCNWRHNFRPSANRRAGRWQAFRCRCTC